MAPTGVAQTQTLHRRGKKTPTKESAPEVEEVEEVEEINPEAGNRPLSSSPPRKCPAHGMAKGFLSGTEGIFGPEASIFGPSRSALKNGQEQGGRCPMRSLGEAKGILGKLKWGLWNCWVTMTNPLDELDPTPVRLPEGMTMEEAMKKCPHLAEKVKAAQAAEAKGNQGGKVGSSGRCPHSEGGGDKGSRAKGEEDKVGGSGQCPHSKEAGDNGAQVKGRDAKGKGEGNRCPYQNQEAYEWPMRAVMLFLAYNFISSSLDIEIIKVAFILAACYMGYLRLPEFVVLYITTGRMSSYKLLGLLLMMTNRGGPVWQWENYRMTPLAVTAGVLVGVTTILLQWVVMKVEIAQGMYTLPIWEATDGARSFSPLFHVVVPFMSEFVYRDFLMKEMAKDLGAWFGVLGSAIWYGVMARQTGGVPKLVAMMVQGIYWGLATVAAKRNIVVPTVAHIISKSALSLFPELNQFVIV